MIKRSHALLGLACFERPGHRTLEHSVPRVSTVPPESGALTAVLRICHVRPPHRCALGDGKVCHEVIRARAVPVLLAIRREDDIACVQLDDPLTAHLDTATPLGDVQRLTAVVRVPGAAGARCEPDGEDVESARRQATHDGVDPESPVNSSPPLAVGGVRLISMLIAPWLVLSEAADTSRN